MRRILLDANVPSGLLHHLPSFEVKTAYRMGWSRLTNGDLLAAAEADGFEVLITGDRNIQYQQNLTGRRIAIVELSTTHAETVVENAALIEQALQTIEAGAYVEIQLPRPKLRRRPYPREDEDA